jgi:hypothetical protein
MRFRALHQGDYVAAKVSSRDLWILARVMQDYPGFPGSPADFLSLTDQKREALFKDKVLIKDVEEKDPGGGNAVGRSFILPLPRTFAEAADWASRCKKGTRVYAMYPMTTSLYSGTVIDNTTYCRGDDDIVVVEFDGDEQHPVTGKLPQYHIPARFVTLIPKEFPAAQNPNRKRKSTSLPKGTAKRSKSTTSVASSRQQNKHKRSASTDSALNNMLDEIAYGDLNGDDLALDQFDLGFDLG